MLSKISSMLDAVADSLEKKGFIKEAYEIDKIADQTDEIDFDTISKPVPPPKPIPKPNSPEIYKDTDFIRALDDLVPELKKLLDNPSDKPQYVKIIHENKKTPLINLIETFPDPKSKSGRSFYDWSDSEKRQRSLNRGYNKYTGNPIHTRDERQKMIFVQDYLNYKLQKTYYSYSDKAVTPIVNGYAGPPFFYTMYIAPKPKKREEFEDLDF